jgi:uncharacterized membrane protein YccC
MSPVFFTFGLAVCARPINYFVTIDPRMKLPSAAEALFTVKSFAGAMLALYLALRAGLPRPFWAMMTAYIVANPFSGAVRSKGLYRVSGTLLGSVVAVCLVPLLANAPEMLSLAIALWVGGCLYISLLDRSPRSYVFMLAGYTAALIVFPTVTDPSLIFDVAVARVEEITLGIVCATLVHSLVFPHSIGSGLLTRFDHAIGDVERWIADVLSGVDDASTGGDRRTLAGDITGLQLLATHLPFDTSQWRWTTRSIHALQNRLAAMIPLLSSIEDRIKTLHSIDATSLLAERRALLNDIASWSRSQSERSLVQAAALRERIAGCTPVIGPHATWAQLIMFNLGELLLALVDAIDGYKKLRHRVGAGYDPAQSAAPSHQTGSSSLHRDHRLALMSGFAAACAIGTCCAFWIISGWPAGSGAAMMAAIFCCFFATLDDPVPAIKTFFVYTGLSVPLAALYVLILIPAVHSFEMLVMVFSPVFLVIGVFISRPATSMPAFAMLSGIVGMIALQDTGVADIVSLVNNSLAQLAGIGAAAICTSLFRSVSAEWTARRVLHAGWADLSRLAQAKRAPADAAVSLRLLDRIGLLSARLALPGLRSHPTADEALNDLQIGLNLLPLLRLRDEPGGRAVPLRPLLDLVSRHFEQQHPDRPLEPAPALRELLDTALRKACCLRDAHARRNALVALIGLRRGLFPGSPEFQDTVLVEMAKQAGAGRFRTDSRARGFPTPTRSTRLIIR